jgi:ABC-type polysaccharide/polyol phosphate export permease
MTIDRIVMGFAGTVVLLGLLLALYVHPNWYWLSAFVGANLLQSSFTGFCPLAMLLKKLGVTPGPAFG